MKILLMTNEYPPHIYGGAGVHIDNLSRSLTSMAEVEVRCFGKQQVESPPLAVRGFSAAKEDFAAPPHLRSIFAALRNCLDFNGVGIDADVVHCHTWYTHMAGVWAKLTYGTPLVVTVHSLEPLRPWKREQLGRGYDFSCWIEKTAMEMADAVIAVSAGTRRDVLQHFEIPEERIHTIFNGIDPSRFCPVHAPEVLQQFGIDPNIPYVLFVGRITRQKGIIHLVEAINAMDPGFQVVLAAGAPDTEEIGREMKSAVEQVSAQRQGVFWIDTMLSVDTLVPLYAHAAVFCCPSIYEPFGIINLEAMACETAVVGSRVGGIPEVVVDGETGLLVSLEQESEPPFRPADPAAYSRDLATAINSLMADPERRTRMGKAGRARALQHFSWDAIARQTHEVYQSLLDPGK